MFGGEIISRLTFSIYSALCDVCAIHAIRSVYKRRVAFSNILRGFAFRGSPGKEKMA